MSNHIQDQDETSEKSVACDGDDAINTLEWLPPDRSPRLKCWKTIDFDAWRSLAHDICSANPGIGSPLLTAIARLALCWKRLRDDYLSWFIPQGPPGTHAHVHYSQPADKEVKKDILEAMAVDYEAALVFLDTALDLTARGFGVLTGLAISSWKTLVTEAEKTSSSWMSDNLKGVVKGLQRGALYTRNMAIVHPRENHTITWWDNTGNITHVRVPIISCEEAVLLELDDFWHRVMAVREECHVGDDGLPAWRFVEFIDLFCAAQFDDADRRLLFDFREKIGFASPGTYVIAPAVDMFVSELVAFRNGLSSEEGGKNG